MAFGCDLWATGCGLQVWKSGVITHVKVKSEGLRARGVVFRVEDPGLTGFRAWVQGENV